MVAHRRLSHKLVRLTLILENCIKRSNVAARAHYRRCTAKLSGQKRNAAEACGSWECSGEISLPAVGKEPRGCKSLRLHSLSVGVTGFEPAPSWSRTTLTTCRKSRNHRRKMTYAILWFPGIRSSRTNFGVYRAHSVHREARILSLVGARKRYVDSMHGAQKRNVASVDKTDAVCATAPKHIERCRPTHVMVSRRPLYYAAGRRWSDANPGLEIEWPRDYDGCLRRSCLPHDVGNRSGRSARAAISCP